MSAGYYRRGRGDRSSAGGQGSRWMALRYAGTCKVCGEVVAAGERAFWDAGAKTVTCDRNRWACARADGLVGIAPGSTWVGNPNGREELRAYRVGAAAPVHPSAARSAAGPRVIVSRFNSGATVSVNARGRCEDAPCCGCCT